MSNEKHFLKCDECNGLIAAEDIKLEAQIVSKVVGSKADSKEQRIVAVRYYFNCPHCLHDYTCFL